MGSFSLCAQLQSHSENSATVIGEISKFSHTLTGQSCISNKYVATQQKVMGWHCALSALKAYRRHPYCTNA